MERYNIKFVEKKWQNFWSSKKTNVVDINKKKKKFYCLEMFWGRCHQNDQLKIGCSYGSPSLPTSRFLQQVDHHCS